MKHNKTKVLLFNPLVTAGGISKILSDYVNNFSNDIDVEMMTLQIRDNIYFEKAKLKIHEIGVSKNIFKRMKSEYKIIKENNYDVVHVNGDYCTRFIECMVAKRAGVKRIIIHSHNTNSGNGSKLKKIIHIITKKLFDLYATDYFACSDDAAKWMFSKKIYKNKYYHFVKNGIDMSKYKYNEKIRNDIRKELDLTDKFVVGHIGRFQYQKNHEFLVDAFYKLQEKKKDAILLLIGSGELEQTIREKIDSLNIADKVIILGTRADAYKYYNAMDCFALPSFFEGLAIVAIEAQASGLPTFVYKEVPEAANVSKNFIKLDSFDASLWAEMIIKTKLRDRKDAYKDVDAAGYNIKDVVIEIEDYYRGMVI